jgi:MFS family permease
MGGLLTLPSFVETFPRIDVVNTTGGAKSNASTMQGLTIGLYEIGCMIGALSTLYLGDKYGRRKLIWWGSAVMIIGAVIQTASYHLEQLIIARIVSGVGNGWITATVPVWQSECARAEHRGYLVMIEGALITGGVAFSYGIDLAFYFVPGAVRRPVLPPS